MMKLIEKNENTINKTEDIETETKNITEKKAEKQSDEQENEIIVPSTELLENELQRVIYKKTYNKTLRATVNTLVVVAAISVLIVTLWMPVLQIYGNSMNPVLTEGDLIISIKGGNFKIGDAVAFYYGNKLLVKRFIAGPSQWVNIDMEGNVYVDDVLIEEPYIKEKALGDSDLEYPYQVPENKYFVMGDNRAVSVDSRNTILGCPSEEQIVGKVVFRVWPLNKLGKI